MMLAQCNQRTGYDRSQGPLDEFQAHETSGQNRHHAMSIDIVKRLVYTCRSRVGWTASIFTGATI